jgi:hypothetical protein
MRSIYAGAAAVLLVLSVSGCSQAVDAAKSKAGDAVTQAECTAVSAAKSKLGGIADADPATLDTISGAVGKVTAGIGALGDKVPAAVKDQITTAQKDLDDAIAKAKSDPAATKAALTSASDKLSSGLDSLSSTLGC